MSGLFNFFVFISLALLFMASSQPFIYNLLEGAKRMLRNGNTLIAKPEKFQLVKIKLMSPFKQLFRLDNTAYYFDHLTL